MKNETYFLANTHPDVVLDPELNNLEGMERYIEIKHPTLKNRMFKIEVDATKVSGRREGFPCSISLETLTPTFKQPLVTSLSVKVFVLSKYDVLYQVTPIGIDVDILPVGSTYNIDDLEGILDLWRKFSATIDLR